MSSHAVSRCSHTQPPPTASRLSFASSGRTPGRGRGKHRHRPSCAHGGEGTQPPRYDGTKEGPALGVPTSEGPRRAGRDGRRGGRGAGEGGHVPGYPRHRERGQPRREGAAGHALSTAGKGGERQLATAHARRPPLSHHYL